MMAKTKTAPAPEKITPGMQRADKLRGEVVAISSLVRGLLNRIEPLADSNRPASELAHLYMCVRDMREALQTALEPLASEWKSSGVYDLLGKTIIPKAFERESIGSFTSLNGYRVTVSMRYLASMKDKAKGIAWLKANGLGDLVQPTVNASTLSAAGAKMIDDGKELPDDIFECYFQPGTSLVRTKK